MMYWTDRGKTPMIASATMDGTKRKQRLLFSFTAWPIGLAIDHEGERLFWSDAYTDTIRSALFNGSDDKIVIHQPGTIFFGLALLGMNLYYTDLLDSYVHKINISHSTPASQQVGPGIFNRPKGITAYSRKRQTHVHIFIVHPLEPNASKRVKTIATFFCPEQQRPFCISFRDAAWNSPCRHLNGGCPHICLPTPTGPQCACPDGLNFVNGAECAPPPYKCPREYTAQNGRIQSPGYPGYRNNMHCVIIVRLNNTRGHERRVRLHVDEFNLEDKYDYLVIGSTKKAGSDLQAGASYTVTTNDEDFRWLFVTDGSIVGNGFSFRYEVLYCDSSNPCMNGGTCVNGEICKCRSGYDGNYCEKVETSSCRSSPCHNGGQCQVETSGYKCNCPIGTSGDNCEKDACASVTCQHGGTCIRQLSGTFCECRAGFAGQHCETDIDECASNPCQNGRACVDETNRFLCRCGSYYRGTTCEYERCASDTCQNGGTCLSLVEGTSCQCPGGFAGQHCETDADECASRPCLNGGTCVDETNRFRCVCEGYFKGTTCQYDMNTCRSHPCLNGGSCRSLFDAYTCDCADGFTGDVCNSPPPCTADSCHNGGTCLDTRTGPSCVCPNDLTGRQCDLGLMATVPASAKKRMDVKLRLKNAIFKDTLKDKGSKEYATLKIRVEKALKETIDDTMGQGKYEIVDVTFRAGSIEVIYVIEMLKGAPDPSTIVAAIKQRNGSFAGFEMDRDSVEMSELSSGQERQEELELPDKNGLSGATIGIIVGALVGLVLVGIAIGETIYCLTKKSRNRAAKQADQNRQEGPTANRTRETSDVYLSLQFNNPNFDGGDDDHYDIIGNIPMSHEQ
ncbi:hypothetical protein LSAT2_010115 [Lamellibrachia satsuma]|nr:hypothetical protein LSAT2_010115 [Lamellibrachia satsuma]